MRKYINQQDMKQGNAVDVFTLVRSCGSVTRKELEQMTALSWGAVSNITARLLKEAYLVESKDDAASGVGRTPGRLAVNGQEHFVLGLDINASGFSGVLINLKNEILATVTQDVPQKPDRDTLLSAITAFAKKAAGLAGGKHILGAGVAMQGQVDATRGLSLSLPFCPDWQNVPLAAVLSEELAIPVFVAHDPNCLLYAWTQTEEDEDTILLRVDNGIGMAVLMDGKISDRPGMYEIGHLPAVPGGYLCGCGRRGCLECYASRAGMARRAGTSFEALAQNARTGDPDAKAIFSDAAGHLAKALVLTSRLLAVPNVVLCGQLWEDCDLIFDALMTRVEELAGRDFLSLSVRIMSKQSANAAYGAALIAVEQSLERS